MPKSVLASRLEDAARLLVAAEEELAIALHKLTASPDGEKTLVTQVLQDAVGKLRNARLEVAEVERLLAYEDNKPGT